MSGPCLSSSVAGRPLRPATRHSLGEPLPLQLADRPRAHPETSGCPDFSYKVIPPFATCGINSPFDELSPISGQVAHVLRTLAPLSTTCIATSSTPLDLHVLSTPPAFVLSQNQTLRKEFAPVTLNHRKNLTVHLPDQSSSLARGHPNQGSFSLTIFEIQRFDVQRTIQFSLSLFV